jgi:hypothetical protein
MTAPLRCAAGFEARSKSAVPRVEHGLQYPQSRKDVKIISRQYMYKCALKMTKSPGS